jgi:UDP-glucose 4-epimerase
VLKRLKIFKVLIMKLLITGGAGFIGSHVAELMLSVGHEVHVLDDLSSGFHHNIPDSATFHKMDIRDSEIHSLWKNQQFDILIHLAAQMDVRKSVADPVFDVDVNLLGFLNLMEAGRNNGLRKVLFASTGGAAFDDDVPYPTPETTPSRPISPYGIAKVTTEAYLRYYQNEYKIPYVALRFGNVYGPRQNPHGEAGVIAIFTKKMLQNHTITINGDGLQTRDYVYCKDVACAFEKGLHYSESDVFHIGTETETDVVSLFQAIKKITNSLTEEIHGPAMGGEVRRSCLSTKKAKEELRWQPLLRLQEGLKETADFFRHQLESDIH